MLSIQPVCVWGAGAHSNEGWLITSGNGKKMEKTYKFDEALSDEMQLPPTTDSIAVLNAGYAALVHVLNKRDPGFTEEVLSTLDELYDQNKDLPGRFAIAQLAAAVRVVRNASE